MRWGIRNQILLPFAAVLLTAIALTAVTSAWLAAERSERRIAERLARVLKTLRSSNIPYPPNVLAMMQGLSGVEYVVLNEDGEPTAATLEEPVAAGDVSSVRIEPAEDSPALSERTVIELNGERYFATGYRRVNPYGRPETLIVLYPESQLRAARREAALPPLIVGGVTLIALFLVSAWLAARIGRRIRRVQEQVARIAEGDFQEMPTGKTRDEIFELVRSINRMSLKLREFEAAIQRTERSQLLGQLAGGLAHQLRNAVTGAKIAIQLHQRRCETEGDRESLDVALRQLALTEEHVKSLLSVGKREAGGRTPAELADILEDVAALVSPVCSHEGISFTNRSTLKGPLRVADSESVRSAVLNLALNAVEAAGPNGVVEILTRLDNGEAVIEVYDTGPGPPPALAESLFEPFATGKPEGVGLGLALVKQTAETLGGQVGWERNDGRTVFRLRIPAEQASRANANTTATAPAAGI